MAENAPLFPRGEAEWYWHMGHPHTVWPFRCKDRLDPTLRCRRWRGHAGPHWARFIWWTDSGGVQDDRLAVRTDAIGGAES